MKNTSDDFEHINTTNTMHNFASLRVLDGTEEEEEEEEEEEDDDDDYEMDEHIRKKKLLFGKDRRERERTSAMFAIRCLIDHPI